jgi:hypothetical protein
MGAKRRLNKHTGGLKRAWQWLTANPPVLAALITALGTITAALLAKLF